MIPYSLKLFLKPLLKQDRSVTFRVQSIIKMTEVWSVTFTNVLCASTGTFGSKWMLNKMYSLKFCESYHGVSNYKYCYISRNVNIKIQSSKSLETIAEKEEPKDDNINMEMLLLDECEEEIEDTNIETSTTSKTAYSGAQYVCDNIDLNIVSANGNTSFHAMSMIKVSKSTAVTDTSEETKTSRQSCYIEGWRYSN